MTLKKNLAFISVFMLIATSAIPFFMGQLPLIIIGLMFTIAGFLLHTNRQVDRVFLLFMAIVMLLQIFQGAIGGQYFWATYFGFMLRFFWGYMVIRITKINFLKIYVNLLYFFSVISIFFYVAMVVIPNSQAIFEKLSAPFGFFPFTPTNEDAQTFHIIIYNFHGYKYLTQSNESLQMIRNSGPFWEPGVFVGFLVFAIFFLYVSEGTIKNKKGLVFILAMITTYSTTGYLALMLSLYVLLKAEFNRYKVVVVPLILAVSVFAFFNVAFLNNKIKDQSGRESDYSRFGSAMRDLKFFFESPFFGQGRNADSAYGKATTGEDATTNNGLTSILASMGFVYFGAFSWMMLYSLKRLSVFYERRSVIPLYFIFLLVSFSETYYTIPFFMALAFLYVITDYKLPLTITRRLGTPDRLVYHTQ